MKKSVIMVICFFLLSFFTAAIVCAESEKPVSALINDGWHYSFGDNMEWASPNFDDSSWQKVTPPEDIVMNKERGWYWMRITCSVPSELAGSQLWFDTGTTGTAFDVYVDGVYIGSRGTLPPNYNARIQLFKAIPIPSVFYEDDGEITIALRGYVYSSIADFDHYALCNTAQADVINYAKNILNMRMYLVLSILCAFIGLYFLFQFQFQKQYRYNLYFALSALSVALYFLDMGAEHLVLPIVIQRMLGRTMLPLSLGFLLLFYMDHYKEKALKVFKPVIYGIMILISVLYICFTGNDALVNTLFTLSLLPVFVSMIYSVFIMVKAYRRKEKNMLPMLIGFVLGFALAMHDLTYQVIGKLPFAWLQGLSFFSLNISVFISLSMQSASMQRDLDVSASAIQKQRDSLSELLTKAESLSLETSSISGELDSSVGSVAVGTASLAVEAESIGSLVEKQNSAIVSARNAVDGLAKSLGTVTQELAVESESISRTVDGTASLINGFSSVGDGITGAAKFSEDLNRMMETGRDNMDKLADAMEQVKTFSADIMSVVTVVNEFSEQTNLLAMNASIEAAHAGIAGKGFSVIAQEIKKLAGGSTQQAEKIKDIVSGIESSINKGFELSVKVKTFLSDIERGARETSEYVRAAAEDMKKQQVAGNLILAESRSLSESADKVKVEAQLQSEYSSKVQGTMMELSSAAEKVGTAASDIIQRNNLTAHQAEEMKMLAARSRKAAEDLSAMMKLK